MMTFQKGKCIDTVNILVWEKNVNLQLAKQGCCKGSSRMPGNKNPSHRQKMAFNHFRQTQHFSAKVGKNATSAPTRL